MTAALILVGLVVVGAVAYRCGRDDGRSSGPPRLPPMSPDLTKRYIIEQLRR